MKRGFLSLGIMVMLVFHSASSFGHGIITHLGLAQNIIDRIKQGNSGIPDNIASIITKNSATEKAFRGGALDSDLLLLVDIINASSINRSTHENCSILIASLLLKNAKTDLEKAYAYGWALGHLPSDVLGHPLVNIYAANGGHWGENEGVKWDYNSSYRQGTNASHVQTEYQFDGLTLDKFDYDKIDFPEAPGGTVLKSRLNLDIDIPINFLQDAIVEGYGQYPGVLPLYAAELLMQAYLTVRADSLTNSEPRPQDPQFNKNFQDSLDEIIKWMKNPAEINRNYGLDDGKEHKGECRKLAVPIIQPGAGGDHSDDTAGSSTLEASGDASFEDWLRIGVKKGNRGALLIWELRNKLDALKVLPEGADPSSKYQKEKELIDFVKANINEAGLIEAFREGNPALIEDLLAVEDVGVLENGFPKEMGALVAKFKEPTNRIHTETFLDSIKDKKAIIIPSGGLFGLEKSEFFKASLDEYVKNGGTLIVFGQQHGYEFSVLPVPQEEDGTYKRIGGYGWSEDQSCQYNSSYINNWHQMLSGQSRSTPSLNIDGYFTEYPSNTTVILRRTSNGQPSLLTYDYGQGKVIVTSMYSDYASAQNQASFEEIALVRDMISWAKNPAQLPEIKPGQSVTVSVSATNATSTDASTVKLLIYNPDRTTLLSEQSVSVFVPAGRSTTIPVTYTTTPTSPLGIYHVDHVLYDSSGAIIQPQAETDSGRFVVSNPPTNEYKPVDLLYSINTPREEFLLGQPVPFTVTIWNNSNEDKKLKIYWDLSHLQASYLGEVTVAAHGTLYGSYAVSLPRYSTTVRLWVHLFEENGTPVKRPSYVGVYRETWPYIGSCSKGLNIIYPSIGATILMGKPLYAKGENVIINTSFKNETSASYETNARITVTDPNSAVVFEDIKAIDMSAKETTSFTSNFGLPSTSFIGTYIVRAEALYRNDLGFFLLASTRFDLPQSQISVQADLPSVFNPGTNTIPLAISNTGKINVNSGTVDLSLKGPDGGIVYSGSQPFGLLVGETKTLDIPVSIPSLRLGSYTLTYSQSDETRTGNPTNITIPNSMEINLSFDKPSYRVRETVNLNTTIKNTGKFNLENISVTVSAPDVNFIDTKTISLSADSDTTSLNYSIPIPENVSTGWHDVNTVISLPGGGSISQNTGVSVPASSLLVKYEGPTSLSTGDSLQLVFENTGGVDTGYETNLYLFDKNWWIRDTKTASGQILASGQDHMTYTLPGQLGDGNYVIEISIKDTKTNIAQSKYFYIGVTGISGSLAVRTDKAIYFSSENTTTLSIINNQGKALADGNLHLEIVCSGSVSSSEGKLASFHIYTMDSSDQWTEHGILHFLNFFQKKEMPLPGGSSLLNSLLIQHEGAQRASIDYIALKGSDGRLYGPAVVAIYERGITQQVRTEDGNSAEVTGGIVYAYWDDLPSGLSYTLVMTAMEENQCGIVWETDTTINQGSGITDTLNISAGSIGQAGKYYLKGELTNSLEQSISTSLYPFYIIDGDTVLQYNTDKRLYKIGEPVTITGRIENRAGITAEDLTLTLISGLAMQSPVTLFIQTCNLPAGGSQPFTITTAAGSEGIVTLSGVVTKDNAVQISINDQYEVALPDVYTYVTIPQTAGNEAFPIEIELYNDGKVNATVRFGVQSLEFGDSQTLTIPPGESKILQYTQQISKDTGYTFTTAGDLVDTQTYTVKYGFGAAIKFGDGSPGLGIKPEGNVDVAVTVTNTGQMNENLAVTYQLTAQNLQPVTITRAYNLQPGANTTDTLNLNLTEGDYQINASSQKPDATARASFSVRKENQVQMGVSLGAQTDGLIPVNINLTNLGFNQISGSVNVSVSPSAGSGQAIWNGEECLSQLSPQSPQLINFTINPSAIEPGNYNLQVALLSNSNQPISTQSLPFAVQGATFQITQLPPYQTFPAGQEATFVFRVRNIGGQEGSFDLGFKAYDLIDSTQRGSLKAGEEKDLTFGFMFPEDLEERDYFADYELKASAVAGVPKGQIKYHLAGVRLNVSASLDKPYYNEGETAHLTINIQSPDSNPQNLFARVNYAGYEPQQTFTLNGSQVLIFDVPLPKITGEKLFYGIYHESGRSVHLNSLYIHKAGEVLTIETNKQVYNPGETVSVTASGNTSGTLTFSAPAGYTETFTFTGSATRGFTLPAAVAAGTYFIGYQLSAITGESYTGTHPFDIAGIQVKVLECNNDKGKYASSDTITTSFTISSNTAMPAILKAWIVDPTGQYTSVGEQSFSLSVPESSLVTQVSQLTTSVSGIHRLVYGIYGPEELLLCSGSEAFDVGDAVIMGISTDKRDYPTNTEPVTVTASLFGSVAANLDFELDGSVVKSETISLNGFTPYTTQLQNIIPGPHTLKATLTAGGLKSTKEIRFTYAQAYMPKPQISASPASLDFGSINLGSSSIKTVTLSSTGNVDLVIGTIILSGTNQGEFSIQNDSCSGRTIVPSRNCTLDVFFSPASLGTRSASLSVSSNGIDTPTLRLSLGGAGATTLIVSINPSGSGRVTGTGIDCPGDCTESFATAGATIQLTVTPTEGYRFANWTGDVNSAENSVTVNMDTDKNVTAGFAINPFTVNATAGLGGIISPSGSVTVNYGGCQTFTIMPNAGYHVADVKVDGVSVGGVLAYTFSNVTSDHTVEVIFGINQYALIATAGPNGAIVPSGPVIVDHGGNLTFTITPNPDYRISDVKVDGGSIGPLATYTFTNVTAAHTIEASFVVSQHTIISTAGSDGTITPSGAISVDHGGSQTFTITPNSGYRISDVEVDGVMLGVTKSYTFGNVAADHTIRATFKQIQLVNLPFSDDFEDDPVGTQPNLPWDSFNGGSAIVTSSGSHSLANSIFVSNGSEGSGSAFVNLGDTYPDRIAYEVWAKVNSTASGAYVGFSEEILGIVPQFNAVYFNGTDGKVYLTSADREHGFTVPLLDSFAVGVWHKVRVQIDFTDLIADVFIDDVLVGSGLQVSPKNATWEHGSTYFFQLNKVGVAHSLGEAIRFDDFSVSEWNSNTPVNLLRSAGPGQWALLGMGGIGSASSTSISMSGSSSVRGTVANTGVANAGNVNMSGSSFINGTLSLNTAGRLNKSGTSTVVGIEQNSATDGVLDQAVADALTASQSAAALPPTITSITKVTISNPSQNITITGGTGINVLSITNLNISNGTLTLNAPHSGSFIMNVSGSFALSGASRIVLAGGITASDVLYNFVGSGGGVAMSGGASVVGILLAPQRGISLSNSIVTGEIISGGSQVAFSGTTQVNNPGP